LSLESGTNIKLPFRVCLWGLVIKITNKSQGSFYYCYFLSIKNPNFL